MVSHQFWRGKRVLLTGHTGFKGAWLALWLQDMGAEVTGYALPAPTEPSLFEAAGVARGMTHVVGDVRDLDRLRTVMQQANPEAIIHMAAQPLVRDSYEDPVGTYATNVMGTVHVLEAARRAPSLRALLSVTSDKAYENREWVWGYRENEAMGGHDPYSSSKGCAELVTAAYRRSFFSNDGRVGVASARAGNVIGGGDWAKDRLVVDAMKAFMAGKALSVRNPLATRPWQHVLDPLSGYLRLCRALWDAPRDMGDGWNFGPVADAPAPVGQVADRLAALWGQGARWETDAGAHPHEARSLRLDCSKAMTLLGWRPKWGLEQALRATVAWYREFAGGGDMRGTTLAQIAEWEAETVVVAG